MRPLIERVGVPLLGERKARKLVDDVEGLERLASVRELTVNLRP
jgi:hypothetical protein